ncbi:uncharacterized protein LOC128709211 [Anopheles marshallii]|uniref:uncharacterized protein LOC128709211 n=1 Tax=Anopheles marshallii TaxID=1521116 RepID=UPI00237C29D8|nr:uncharacterized protein LOC128709211 [Anopheles marshallii]
MYRALAFICTLSVCVSYVFATQCPACFGVQACHTNQTVPKVTCTAAIVNQTVIQLSTYFKNVSEFTATSSKYSCVKVSFKPQGSVNDTFAVQGCTAGTKSICKQPTYQYNGNLSCYSDYDSGATLHKLAQNPLNSALLSVAIIIGTLMISS